LLLSLSLFWSRDNSVVIATGYGLDGQGSIPGIAKFFFSPQRQDWLWSLPSRLSNGYRGLIPRGVKRYIPENGTLRDHRCENLKSPKQEFSSEKFSIYDVSSEIIVQDLKVLV
jgi:hypothetical protein